MLTLHRTYANDSTSSIDCKVDVSSKRVSSGNTETTGCSSCDDDDTSLILAPSPAGRSTRVKFIDEVTVHRGLGRHQYSRRELKSCWYSQQDLSKANEDQTKVLECLANANDGQSSQPLPNDMTMRGLEAWTTSGAARLSLLNRQVTSVVLYEQLRQQLLKLNDPETIASKYQAVSQWSAMKAMDVGAADEMDAKEALALMEDIMDPPKRRGLSFKNSLRLLKFRQ